MTHEQLLDVFYGRDYLTLVCNAKRFRLKTENRISFIVGEYVVRLHYKRNRDYSLNLLINRREDGSSVFNSVFSRAEDVRRHFTRVTGLSLEL